MSSAPRAARARIRRPAPSRPTAALALPALAAALVGACADAPAHRLAGAATADRPAALAPAAESVVASFAWLAPTLTSPAPAPADTFDAPALARLAVEVCPATPDAGACAAAPVARYTAATVPYAQQVRADTVRQAFLVYWATGAAPAGAYRARVLDGGREVGALAVRVAATSAELSAVDRTRQGAVLRGQAFALRFRLGRATVAVPNDPAADSTDAETVRAVADQLVAVADSGVDVTPGVRAVLDRLLPVLGPAQAGEVGARLAAGFPVAFDFQADLVARAFNDRGRTSRASLVAAAAAAGATLADGRELTDAALTAAVRPLVGRARYGPEELVPALVLALGEARAARAGSPAPDPVWGDAQLDPLQTMLLMYALQFSGLDAVAPPAAEAPSAGPARRALLAADAPPGGVRAWVGGKLANMANPRNRLRGWVTGRIGKAVQMPLTWGQAAQASACASVLLNSYRFAVSAAPTQLGRVGLGLPTTSAVDATLTFDFVPNAFGAAALRLAGCALPPNGAAAGKTVTWDVAGDIRRHGTLVRRDAATGAGGVARAEYQTVAEQVPAALRVLARDATGTVDVRATGLVPGWATLERSVGVGVQNPTDAGVRLRVRHHEWPSRARLDFTTALDVEGLMQSEVWHVGRAGSLTLERQSRGGAIYYHASGPAAYTHFTVTQGGECVKTPTGTRAGGFGFLLVAHDSATGSAPLAGMASPTTDVGAELFTLRCGGVSMPNEVGGFYGGLLAVYEPIAPGALPFRTKNPVTAWAADGPGVLRAAVERRIAGAFAPTTERSTFRLTFAP